MEVTPKSGGRWALSKIIYIPARDCFTTSASFNRLASRVENHFPPFDENNKKYTQDWALVRLEGNIQTPDINTTLLPEYSTTDKIGNTDFLNAISSALGKNYSYVDYDNKTINVPLFDKTEFSVDSTYASVLKSVYKYLQHSSFRSKPSPIESHNTEFSDNFDDDPYAARWTSRDSSLVYDSTNDELGDTTGGGLNNTSIEYTAGNFGSIEHETQGTFLTYSVNGDGWNNACGVRYNNSADQNYHLQHEPGATTGGVLYLLRKTAGTNTELTSFSIDIDVNTFRTARMSASGAAGANVVINIWYVDHGTSKPSDPGWIGVDGTPNQTYTDTAAGRHDDADDLYGGIALFAPSASFDNRIDFWKGRAISDRVAGSASVSPSASISPSSSASRSLSPSASVSPSSSASRSVSPSSSASRSISPSSSISRSLSPSASISPSSSTSRSVSPSASVSPSSSISPSASPSPSAALETFSAWGYQGGWW